MILHHKTYGSPHNPCVCIAHGLFGTLDNWHLIAKSLSTHFYVVTVDLRNHGQSPHSDDMTFELMAEDVVETLRSISISECSFMGHSMGGKVVMKLVELHPDMVHKLVVVDIAPKTYQEGHNELFDAMFKVNLNDYKNRSDIETALKPGIPDEGVRLFLMKNIQRVGDRYAWKLNLEGIHQHYQHIISGSGPTWPIHHPTLFVKGEKSGYISKEDEAMITGYFPLAEFATISSAGHWVHADNAPEFLNVVMKFLA